MPTIETSSAAASNATENELRAQQAQLAAAQEIASIGSWTYDFALDRRDYSDSMLRLYGFAVDAQPSLDDFFERMHPDDRARLRALYEQAHATLQGFSTEYRIVHPDTGVRTLHVRTRFVGEPGAMRVIGVLQDVSERKRIEEELRRRADQQAAVANLGRRALTGVDVDALFTLAAAAVEEVLTVEQCIIERTDDAGPLPADASVVTVPISSADDRPWGVLRAVTRERREFTTHDVDFLRSVATVLGQAIERQRADAELRVRARQQSAIAELGRLTLTSLDDATWTRAADLLLEGLGVDYGFVAELTDAGTMMRIRAGRLWSDALPRAVPVDAQTQAGASMLARAPILVNDYESETRFVTRERTTPYGIMSGVTVPVVGATHTFGLLSAASTAKRRFGESDVAFMQAIANMLADAMERELARAAVAESEERYRSVVEGASEIIFTIEPGGTYTSLNAAFETITGWPRELWLGRRFLDLVMPGDRARVAALFARSDREPVTCEATILGKHGPVLLAVSSFPKLGENGVAVEIYGFARDITHARQVEEERQRVTRSLQLILESSVEGIYTVDVDGRCTMINGAAARLLGRTPDEMLGVRMPELEERAMADGIFLRKDGSTMPVEYSAAPIVDGGARVGVVVTFTDVTDRRRLETKLEQTTRLSSLGRLAATVAHEFNNVLMGISPFVEVLRRNPTAEKTALSLEHIARSVQRGRRITEDILRFTQPAEPVRSALDLEPWLRGIALESRSLLSGKYPIRIDCCEALRINADPNQLHQIFTNLILNARDAMPDGGSITIAARRDANSAHLTVTDTGCGMPAETLQHIFEPLFTTKKNGTGLGLPVTHQVVRRHGGEIFAESTPDAGTTFHIFLPLAAEQQVAADENDRVAAAAHPPVRRILVVEDDKTVAAGLTALLEFEGMQVAAAETGADAIAMLRQGIRPDAVLLDIGLPDMDGPRVYDVIVELHPSLPVVFSTGHGDRSKLEHLLTRPHVSYLMKPYEADALLDTLAQVIGGND